MKKNIFPLTLLCRRIALGGVLVAFSLFASAQKAKFVSEKKEAGPLEKLASVVQEANIPGLSAAIIKNGKVEQIAGLGYRSVDFRDTVNAETVFAAASLSKPVFAYAVLQLVEEGLLELDKPLYTYLEYFDIEHDRRYKKITTRMVLSHTSGFPDWRDEKLNLLFDPGTRFNYSAEGLVYLAKVVEAITDQPFDAMMEQRVFKPLAMKNSSYFWKSAFASNFAIPHDLTNRTEAIDKIAEGQAAWSLLTTAEDYAKFLMAILQSKGLSEKMVEQMLTPQIKVNSFPESDEHISWGLGVGLQQTRQGPAFWHWGSTGNYSSFFVVFQEKKEGIVFLSNSAKGLDNSEALLRAGIGMPASFPAARMIRQQFASEYPAQSFFLTYSKNENFDEAIAPFMKPGTVHHDTTLINYVWSNYLANAFLEMGRLEAAKRMFFMIMAAYPAIPEVYGRYAQVCARNGNIQDAIRYYKLEREKANPANKKIIDLIVQQLSHRATGNFTFRLEGNKFARYIAVAGSFNGWNDITHPMVWENGAWVCRLDLRPGKYEYKFVIDGIWTVDPSNPNITWNNFPNSVLEIK